MYGYKENKKEIKRAIDFFCDSIDDCDDCPLPWIGGNCLKYKTIHFLEFLSRAEAAGYLHRKGTEWKERIK